MDGGGEFVAEGDERPAMKAATMVVCEDVEAEICATFDRDGGVVGGDVETMVGVGAWGRTELTVADATGDLTGGWVGVGYGLVRAEGGDEEEEGEEVELEVVGRHLGIGWGLGGGG